MFRIPLYLGSGRNKVAQPTRLGDQTRFFDPATPSSFCQIRHLNAAFDDPAGDADTNRDVGHRWRTVNITDDPSDRVIVESVIAMAWHLGLRVIAEGVEAAAQAALLEAVRCDHVQGYLYARPMPAEEFLTLVVGAEAASLPLSG